VCDSIEKRRSAKGSAGDDDGASQAAAIELCGKGIDRAHAGHDPLESRELELADPASRLDRLNC
jgi:hypothetical protein